MDKITSLKIKQNNGTYKDYSLGTSATEVINNMSLATTSSNGLMSAQDKNQLETVYTDYTSALTALGVI